MTWQPGRDKITDLISDGELERVEPSDDTRSRLLQDAAGTWPRLRPRCRAGICQGLTS